MAFPIPKPTQVQPSSWFDHSHNYATTLPFGAIVPVDWRPMMPGEKYKNHISGFCRALSLKSPVMQDIDLKYATFFVPLRLLNTNASDIVSRADVPQLKTKADKGGITLDPIGFNSSSTKFPYLNFDKDIYNRIVTSVQNRESLDTMPTFERSFFIGGLMDYLGFPAGSFSNIKQNSMKLKVDHFDSFPINIAPLVAYHLICNHFFVDESHRREYTENGYLPDLRTSFTGCINSSLSNFEHLFDLRYTSYESDYFTKAVSGSAAQRIANSSRVPINEHTDSLNADTIRGMFQLDEFARKVEMFYGDMRKQIKLMFGVLTSDRSAMSPILVDSGTSPVQVSEVTNQSGSDNSASDLMPLGATAGKMMSAFGKGYNMFEVEEHGYMMTLVWIRPRTAYLNKLPYFFGQFIDSDTIPNPLFSQIGRRPIKEWELNCPILSASERFDAVPGSGLPEPAWFNKDFGYTSPYVQYKYTLDSFTGDFRDNLVYWNTAREFEGHISASYEFTKVNPKYLQNEQSLNRIFSVIKSIDGARPFQLQLRFNTEIWQPYPHIDNEM